MAKYNAARRARELIENSQLFVDYNYCDSGQAKATAQARSCAIARLLREAYKLGQDSVFNQNPASSIEGK